MPKPTHLKREDFTAQEWAAIPVVKGEKPTAKDKLLNKEIYDLGREIVDLVNDGKFNLCNSKVIGKTLFVRSGDEYYVLATDKSVEMSDFAEIKADRWPYEGLVSNLKRLKKTLAAWKKEAEKQK